MNGLPPGYPPGSHGPGAPPSQAPAAPAAYGQAPAPGYGQPSQAPQQAYGQPAPAYGYGPPPAYGPSPSYTPPGHFGYQQPQFGGHPQYGAAPPAYGIAPVASGAPSLRWYVLGTFVGAILFSVGGSALNSAADSHDDALRTMGGVLTMIGAPLLIAYFVTALVWLYKSWEMLPESMRVTGNGTRVSPGQAVGYLFIPFYNMYWYFMCSAGLCTALNRGLASYGSPKRASNGLAITAAIFQLMPYVNFVLGPFLWIAFMFNVESAKREYARIASSQPQGMV